jgi:hypothetical protein
MYWQAERDNPIKYLARQLQRDNIQRALSGRRLATASVLLAPLLATSCSNQALFESIQQNHLQRCQAIPIAQQAACEAQYQTSFEEYQREREALLREGASN